jgi:RNA polymerase sigma factor (sigma-70 family)
MASTSLNAVVYNLRQIAPSAADPRDDHELLEAFASRHDQAAFAVLVRRHGSLVLNVCRRVLRHEQDAEDAFQAAFLVLASKGTSLRCTTSVAGFLHGVAYRLALKVRREATRRRRREARVPAPSTAGAAGADLSWREVQAVLEEEIQRLPETYRLPFVLCHLQGLSRAEVGRQLGLKEGTVWSRLSQARARLQERLARRGVVLAAVLGALGVSEKAVRAELAGTVVRAASLRAAGPAAGAVSARVASLAQAGLQTVTGKTKRALLALAALLALGVGSVFCRTLSDNPQAPPATKAGAEAEKADTPGARTDRHGDPLPPGALARLGTVRWRHGFFVQALAYSPDGKSIAAVGAGRAITLWDAASGKEIRQFPNRAQPVGLAFSPDGKVLATTDAPICHLWDVATGKELRRLTGHQVVVRRIVFSPDGKWVATASADGTVRLWDPATGAERRRLEHDQDEPYTVAFSPDGKLLASAGKEGTVRLWDPATGKERRRLPGQQNAIWTVLFSPDGKRLAAVSADQMIRLLDPATGRQLRAFGEKRGDYELPVAFAPDGAWLASGHADGTVRLWDVARGVEKRRWQAGAMAMRAVAFSPDGRTLASGAPWESIRLWDVATGRERHPSQAHLGLVDRVRFAPDGAGLVSVSRDRRMLWWDLATQTPRRRFAWPAEGVSAFALSPDGNTLAATNHWLDKTVRLWDTRTGKPGRLLGKTEKRIVALAYSPDGRLVAAGVEDDGIHVWDVRDGSEVRHIKGFASGVMSLRFSPDSKALACAIWTQGQRSLRMWEVASGKEQVEFACLDGFAGPLAFSPDGKVLAVGTNSTNATGASCVRQWDTATGKELSRHTGHKDTVGAVAFSPDGKLVASGTGTSGMEDNSVHIWEAATGQLIRRFEGHHSCASSVAFAADGLTVASGAGDSTVLLWDITGRRSGGRWDVKPLTPHELDACWTALASSDAARAYEAVWALVAAPEQAVPFLQKHLRPTPRPDMQTVARFVAELGSPEFSVRQRAMKGLAQFEDAVTDALQRALSKGPPLETRRRLRELLDQSRAWTGERLRAHRAIQALEHLKTRQARAVLEALAAGAPGAYRTEEARVSLQRQAR